MNVPGEPVLPPIPLKAGAAARPFGRAANWAVGVVAAGLVLISVGGYRYQREHVAAIVAEHLRLLITGPARLQAGVAAEYMVSTTAINGQPLPVQVEAALLTPDGRRLRAFQETTDARGRLPIAIPGELEAASQAVLSVVACGAQSRAEARIPLPVEPARYAAQAALDKPLYRPGEMAYYRVICLSRFGLSAAPALSVEFEIADPDGQPVPASRSQGAVNRGVGGGSFKIPSTLAEGRYALVVRSPERAFPEQRHRFLVRREGPPSSQKEKGSKSGDETRSATEPAKSAKVAVTFYPEGGDLAAGLENRVYFVARDSQNTPANVSGMLVAEAAEEGDRGREEEIAAVETIREGMGVFSFTPRTGMRYHLRIRHPAGVTDEPRLPEVVADRGIVLSTGAGVFAAGGPLEFNIRATRPNLPLLVAAYCRGVQVGQQPLVTKAGGTGGNPVVIPLDRTVGGVIRLCVYDYGTTPPRPLAERLVYRRPTQKLNVRVAPSRPRYAPGEGVDLSITATNEKGQPAPATLSVAVVDDALLGLVDDRTPPLSTYFLVADEIEGAAGLEEDDFRLLEERSTAAAVALDLWLGTRGWRRPADESKTTGSDHEVRGGPSARADSSGPPAMFDNLNQIYAQYETRLADYQADRSNALGLLVTVSFLGGLGLALLVAMLGSLRIVSGMHLWIPAVGATICCLITGAILTDPDRLATGDGPPAAFMPYHAPAAKAEPSGGRPPSPPEAGQPGGNVPETPYWRPMLVTGADGKASISFELPPAATRFRVMVDAYGDGRIGAGLGEVASGAAVEEDVPSVTGRVGRTSR